MSKDKIEVNMNVYDIPILVEALEEANKEIERLNNELQVQIEDNARLNEYIEEQDNIIKEDKKIEMLPILNENDIYDMVLVANQTRRKINQIIDKINKE